MVTGAALTFPVQDNLGSTAVTTNGTTAASWSWFMPFGELYYYWGTFPTDKRFTGQQREYETEPPNQWNAIYDYGARMYDAKIGRMLQPDALYDPYNPQSLNRALYVLNNPTTYTDPTGNKFVEAVGGSSAGMRPVALNLRPVFEAAASAVAVVVVSGSGAVERGNSIHRKRFASVRLEVRIGWTGGAADRGQLPLLRPGHRI